MGTGGRGGPAARGQRGGVCGSRLTGGRRNSGGGGEGGAACAGPPDSSLTSHGWEVDADQHGEVRHDVGCRRAGRGLGPPPARPPRGTPSSPRPPPCLCALPGDCLRGQGSQDPVLAQELSSPTRPCLDRRGLRAGPEKITSPDSRSKGFQCPESEEDTHHRTAAAQHAAPAAALHLFINPDCCSASQELGA